MNLCVAICLLALTASTKADGLGLGGLGGLVYAPQHASVDYYAYPRYAFEYSVKDPHTGDNKAQWEKRDGDVVKGAYSLVEPDGSLRIVEYHADDKTGFNAVVKRVGPSLHPTTVHAVPIYKAPIPVLSGHGSGLHPISVGPVANLGHLTSAPLISGPIHGGPIYSPALTTQNLIKEPVIVKSLPTPILPEPVLHEPIFQAPIIKGPILQEPYLLEPNLKGPIYKSGPILPGPLLNEPILKGLPGPIYKSGPIYSESLGPLPDYRAPLSLYNKHVPIQREPLPALPLLKGPVGLGLIGKGPLGSLNWEGLGRGPLEGSYGLGKGIGLEGPYLEGHVPLRTNIGPAQLGLLGKGPISSLDWEGLRGTTVGGYGLGKGIGPMRPSLEGHVPLRANIGPAQLGLLGKGPISSLDWEGLSRGPLVGGYGLGKGIGPVRPSLEGHVPLRANIGPAQLGLLGKGPISSLDWEGLSRGPLVGGYSLGKGIGPVRPSLEGHVPLRTNIGPAYLGLLSKGPISSVDWQGPREPVAGGYKGLGPLGPSLEGYGLLKGNIGPILPYAGLEKAPQPSWNGPIEYPLYSSGYKH